MNNINGRYEEERNSRMWWSGKQRSVEMRHIGEKEYNGQKDEIFL